eukprot:TRINITY_DN26194_c0_g1_i1.p1 TRINITY_DN26194_c0_g1~~TRINITY_DN26194_c0_g1_i1.p1  ORF type:complete len:1478 (-),score=275.09 TRINITY_DN26194_c0_g1_i1:378-4394(-)
MFKGGALNTDFGAFLRGNSPSSLRYDAYSHAWNEFNPAPESRRLQAAAKPAKFKHSSLRIVYYGKDGKNLLEEQALFAILRFERRMQESSAWKKHCSLEVVSLTSLAKEEPVTNESVTNGSNVSTPFSSSPSPSMQPSCSPGESLTSYIWPSYLSGDGGVSVSAGSRQQLRLDGKGDLRLPVQAVLSSLRDEEDRYDRLSRFLPKGMEVPDGIASVHSELLQSHFLFSQSIGGPGGYYKTSRKASDAMKTFMEQDLHALVSAPHAEFEEMGIRLFYEASALDDADLFDALWKDLQLSIGGLVLVFLLVRLHTMSWWLAFVGSLVVLECIPLGYVFFKNFTNLPNMSIVNCVATFVIIGVGSDLVFVVTDGWRQSANEESVKALRKSILTIPNGSLEEKQDAQIDIHEKEMYLRLLWVYQHAGSACCTTGICGASSFLVNLMSVLLPLREFGLFMGLCCLFALFLELGLFPFAIVAMESRAFRKRLADEEASQEDEYGPSSTLAITSQVVPCDPAEDDCHALQAASEKSMESALKKRSFLIRMFAGPWPSFISRHPMKILCFFVAWTLVSLIGIALSIKVDSGLPTIFPADHNQVLGKDVMARFSTPTKVAATPATQRAFLCSPTAPRGTEKPDNSGGCGTYTSIGYCSDDLYGGAMESECARTCGFEGYCLANWCSVAAPPNASKKRPGSCDCFEDGSADVADAASVSDAEPVGIVSFETTVFGFTKNRSNDILRYIRQLQLEMLESQGNFTRVQRYGSGAWALAAVEPQAKGEAPLVQQHWRSGTLASWEGFKAASLSVMTHSRLVDSNQAAADLEASGKVKTVKQTCYCDGIAPCLETAAKKRTAFHPFAGPGGTTWQSVVDITTEASQIQRTLPSARRLASAKSTLRVVWGLKVRELGPFDLFVETDRVQMWDLDPMFEPADPWAQRSMLRMTENLPEALRAEPKDGTTWLQAFEVWLTQNNQEFPARDFHQSISEWLAGAGSRYRDQFAVQDGKVVAVNVEFSVALGSADLDLALATMQAWDDWVKDNNKQASIRANQAFHVCDKWVSTEAQSGILRSTVSTILTAVLVGYLAAVFFTQDLLLSIFPMISVLLTVFSLLFTMVGLFQWPFGAVDVIALIVFLGYMFTFNLHIAHSYSHACVPQQLLEGDHDDAGTLSDEEVARLSQQERYCRIQHGLMTIGQSLVSSAGTTSSCAIFLVFCQLQFFVKFGVVILCVTLLSMMYSMLFLPALLVVVGPTSRSCQSLRKQKRLLLKWLERATGKQAHSAQPQPPVTGSLCQVEDPHAPSMPLSGGLPLPLEDVYVDDTHVPELSPETDSASGLQKLAPQGLIEEEV